MNVQASLKLIDHHLKHQEWETACRVCQECLKKEPNWVEGYQRLGQAWVGLGKPKRAMQAYDHCIQLKPNQSQAYGDLGFLLQQAKQFPKAIAHYQTALSIQPTWTEVRFNLAMIFHHLDDWTSAIAEYQQVIEQNPNHLKARFNLAVLYDKQGEHLKAEQAYRTITQLKPTHFNAWNNLGTVLFHRQQYEDAIAAYHQALQVNPESAQVYNNIGQVHLAQDDLDAAIQAHQTAIAIDPLLHSSRLTLGRLWLDHQHYEKALLYLQIVYEQNQEDIPLIHDLAITHIGLGQWAEAFTYLSQIAENQQDFIQIFLHRLKQTAPDNALDQAKQECGKFLQAIQQADHDQALDRLFFCYKALGQALFDYGAQPQAEQYFYQALRLRPDHAELYALLSRCLSRQTRTDSAIAILQMGLTLHPQDPLLTAEQTSVQANPHPGKGSKASRPPLIQRQLQTQEWITAIAPSTSSPPTFTPISEKKTAQYPIPLKTAKAENIEDKACGGVTCPPCMRQLIDLFEPIAFGQNVFQCHMGKDAVILPPPTFVVEIPHGTAWITPQENDWLICKDIAIISQDQTLLTDLSRLYPWYLPGCTQHIHTGHTITEQPPDHPPKQLEGKAAVLSSLSGQVYYHWMIDVLPRIGLLHQSGIELDSIDWFIVNSVSKPFQSETLAKLGIPSNKILESDRSPYVTAPELIVPSFPGHLDWVPQSTIDFLRKHFLSPSDESSPARIYISRADAKYRQVVNEADIIHILEKYGFVNLNLGAYSVSEQAAIFSRAEVIIAPHGAALTNLVFCQPKTQVLEFFSPHYIRTDYWMISHQLQLEHFFIKGKEFKGDFILKLMHQSPLTEDMWIDPGSIYQALHQMGIEQT